MDGKVTDIMHHGLEKIDWNEPVNLVISTCSDARSDPHIAIEIARRVAANPGITEFNKLPKALRAINAQTQQPTEILIHDPSYIPDKKQGGVFAVSAVPGHWGVVPRLSAAYAIMSFGPHGHGPKSLKSIRFANGVEPEDRNAIRDSLGKIIDIAVQAF